METCEYHTELVKDIAIIKTDTGYIKEHLENASNKFKKHVDEGEREGGFRDRVHSLEKEVSALKKAEWARVVVGGIIGGLLGKASPDIIATFLNFITKIVSAKQ